MFNLVMLLFGPSGLHCRNLACLYLGMTDPFATRICAELEPKTFYKPFHPPQNHLGVLLKSNNMQITTYYGKVCVTRARNSIIIKIHGRKITNLESGVLCLALEY
ncbi:hypothetical protein F4777DRAFT_530104 [Nemania sp. FL0916]|nr:hypothetical protein F4777DRAFT_530104 [Nemania sp. FL0916]